MKLQSRPRLDDTLLALGAEARGLDVVLREIAIDDALSPEEQARCASRVLSALSARLTEAQAVLRLYSADGADHLVPQLDLEGGVLPQDEHEAFGRGRIEATQEYVSTLASRLSSQLGAFRSSGRHAVAIALAVVGAFVLATVGVRHVADNVHVVVPGAVYRSAQLDSEHLEAVINRYHIRSVLNLRGARPGSGWYNEEVATAVRAGVAHVDLELSPERDVLVPDADRLLKLMDDLPKPVLIHSQVGADRSGLAAALYLYSRIHHDASAAACQLSAWYGHVPFLRNGTAAMDRSFWSYVQTHRVGTGT